MVSIVYFCVVDRCAFLLLSVYFVVIIVCDISPNDLRIIAVDLQEMAPIDGVYILQGDITSKSTADQIINYWNGEQADMVNMFV